MCEQNGEALGGGGECSAGTHYCAICQSALLLPRTCKPVLRLWKLLSGSCSYQMLPEDNPQSIGGIASG